MSADHGLSSDPGENRQLREWVDWKRYLKEVAAFINYKA